MSCKHEWEKLPDDYVRNYITNKITSEPDMTVLGHRFGHHNLYHVRLLEYCRKCGLVRINPEDLKDMEER